MKKWRRSAGVRRATHVNRGGFTIPEMLAVIAIIIIILSLLMASLNSSKHSTRNAECANNLHQIGLAANSFKADQRRMPNASEIVHALDQYLSGNVGTIYHCPEDEKAGISYGANPCVQKLSGEGGKIVMLDAFEAFVHYEKTSGEEWLNTVAPRHWGKMNVLFVGGNVEHRTKEQINPYASTENLTTKWKPIRDCDPFSEGGIGCGCRATYYKGWFNGESATRIDTSLHMPFGGAFFGFNSWDIPLSGTNPGGWDTGSFGSGVWTGQLRPGETGDYTFHLACDNEAWLYVKGQLLIHRSAGGVDGVTAYQTSAPVHLVAGQAVDIEVRLRELTPGISPSHVSVKWESANMPLSIIPCSALRP